MGVWSAWFPRQTCEKGETEGARGSADPSTYMRHGANTTGTLLILEMSSNKQGDLGCPCGVHHSSTRRDLSRGRGAIRTQGDFFNFLAFRARPPPPKSHLAKHACSPRSGIRDPGSHICGRRVMWDEPCRELTQAFVTYSWGSSNFLRVCFAKRDGTSSCRPTDKMFSEQRTLSYCCVRRSFPFISP